jgi:hypothetical protein
MASCLAVSAHERFRHIRLEPLSGRRRAGKATGTDWLADRGDDISHAIVLELPGHRPLLMDKTTRSGSEGRIRGRAVASVHGFDVGERDTRLVAGESEHGKRLPAVTHKHLASQQFLPLKTNIVLPHGQEESILLVDLGEVDRSRHNGRGNRGGR